MSFHITLPDIAIQKVINGYVVTYKRIATDEERKKSSDQYVHVAYVAQTERQLLRIIKNAY